MATKRYQIVGDIVTKPQLENALKNYVPTDENAEIVSWIESTEEGIKVSMKDGNEFTIPVSQAKNFETVEYNTETNLLHFYNAAREDVYDPVFIQGGTGTGTGTVMRLTNQNGTSTLVGSYGEALTLMFTFTSTEDDLPTGNGTCKITVNNAVKSTTSISQGLNAIDVSPYLNVGSNTVKVTCTDVYGTSKSLTYTVTVIQLSIESNFNATVPYNSDISFKYTPYGSVEKTVHFLVDGTEIGTVVTSLSGKQLTRTIPAMSHGAHKLEVYSTAVLNETELESPRLTYDIIFLEADDTTPIIASAYTVKELEQGALVSIPYIVYDPTKLACDISLTIYTLESGNKVVYDTQNITVDRSQWTWNTRKYPIGEVYFEIKYGNIDKTHKITVAESSIKIEPETNDLELQLIAEGRSNNETNPGQWTYGDVSTTFQNMNWSSTGWVHDEEGSTCLRLNGDARAEIAFKPFADDIRTSGKTLEIEFAIRDVHNRSAIPISCMSGGIGFEVKPDTTILKSEQSEVFCNYKDDERVKVSFTIESRDEYRLLSIYLNGVRSDTVQYPSTDNFQQSVPVNISIGSSDCGVDIYGIRSYTSALTSETVTNNFIADISDIVRKTEVYENNDVYDEYGDISFTKAKEKNSCMVIVGDLPASKGDKKKVTIQYYDIEDSNLDFIEDDVTIDVQGTSSQWYVRKNWKLKFAENHYIDFDHLPAKVVCIKVDYAEATGTHNTQNANFVERLYSELTPAQKVDPKCRSTIYGKPILLFHQESANSDPVFYGKSNFNYDKGAEHVFGFTSDYDVECWEFKNNTSDACNFLGPVPEIWVEDFEARYPEESSEISRFKEMHDWVVSTRRDAATGVELASPFVAEGVSHTHDTSDYRLAKFKMEFEDHFNMHFMLIYYVYTFFLLMVDQRAKNMFLTYWGEEDRWSAWFYDNDTCAGINNEGQLVLDYYHEDTDQLEGANVYNGQNSVLWCNFRDAFPDKIKETYQDLRSNSVLNYDELEEQFITKGSDKWSESVYNEDADFKYISMLHSDNDASNLGQVRGTGEEHFRYFIENRLNYCDGKWYAADYADDYVALRIYTPVDENGDPRTDLAVAANADITVTPFSHMYAGLRYKANGTLQQKRVAANEVTIFEAPDETFNDTETAIYGASQLSSLGDLSPLYCGSINVSKATKLTELIIGNNTAGYSNPNLNDLSVGTNNLLKTLNVRNCPKLTDPLALTGCPNIEEIYAGGSGITGIELANSGYLKTIELPATITNLTLKNQLYIESLTLEGYSAIKTIQIENCPTVDSLDILSKSTNVERVRLTDVDWSYDDVSALTALAARNLAGIDENGINTDKMWVDGKCHIKKLTGAEYTKVKMDFPYLTITYDNLTAVLTYMYEDGNVKLHEETIVNGGDGSGEFEFVSSNKCEIGSIDYTDGSYLESNTRLRTYYIPTNNSSTLNLSFGDMPYAKFIVRVYKSDHSFVRITTAVSNAWSGTVENNWCMIGSGTFDLNAYVKADGLTANDIGYVKLIFTMDDVTAITEIRGTVSINDTVYKLASSPFEKPSTAQYDFTFGGWSLSPNSEPNPDALKNVEADRTVYVAFTKTVRKYTVNFYNGTTLLETQTIEYGSDATYAGETPVHATLPDYMEFTGWKPQPTNIQSNTDCYAQWYDNREITDDWATIAAACNDGTATSKYAIGAYKPVDITYEDGTSETINFEVIGHNHDELADGIRKWERLAWRSATSPMFIYNNTRNYIHSKNHYQWDGSAWNVVATIPWGIIIMGVVEHNGEIHLIGKTEHFKYDGTSWTSVSTLPVNATVNSSLISNDGLLILSNSWDRYEWDGETWTKKEWTNNYNWAKLVEYNGQFAEYSYLHKRIRWYDLSTEAFVNTDLPAIPHYAVIHDNKIYMVLNDSKLYSFDNGVVEEVCNLPVTMTTDGYTPILSFNNELYYSANNYDYKWSGPDFINAIPTNNTHNTRLNTTEIIVYNNDLYQFGNEWNSGIWRWDNGTWTSLGTSPIAIAYGRYVVHGNKIHAFSGSKHYSWDGTEWAEVSTLPFSIAYYCAPFSYNNELHICHKSTHYKYNGTEWVTVGTAPNAFDDSLSHSQAVVYNGEIHLFTTGNYTTSVHSKWSGTEWVSLGNLPMIFEDSRAVVYNGEIHIFSQNKNYKLHYKYDGTNWHRVTNDKHSFQNIAVVYRGQLYVAIGITLYRLENPRATLTFFAKNALKEPRMIDDTYWYMVWRQTDTRKWLQNDFINTLPSDLRTNIKKVNKISDEIAHGKSLVAVEDTVFLLSHTEVGFDAKSTNFLRGQGSVYPVFTNNTSRIRTVISGSLVAWWIRTSNAYNSYMFPAIQTNGREIINGLTANNKYYVVPGFCI